MTKITYVLAEAAEQLPLESHPSPLFPAAFDLFWSVVSLIIVAILFRFLVLPKFSEVLSEREDRIKGGIQRAEAAQAEAKSALEKYNAQLSEARGEAAAIREEAREKGKRIVEEMKADAAEESNRIVEAGHKQLAAQREQVVAELSTEMGQKSILLAEKLLGQHLSDPAKQSETVDAFLSSLDGIPAARK